jgi:hypothetical protein
MSSSGLQGPGASTPALEVRSVKALRVGAVSAQRITEVLVGVRRRRLELADTNKACIEAAVVARGGLAERWRWLRSVRIPVAPVRNPVASNAA